jgi:hypothetical protein
VDASAESTHRIEFAVNGTARQLCAGGSGDAAHGATESASGRDQGRSHARLEHRLADALDGLFVLLVELLGCTADLLGAVDDLVAELLDLVFLISAHRSSRAVPPYAGQVRPPNHFVEEPSRLLAHVLQLVARLVEQPLACALDLLHRRLGLAAW